ncbi:MAG: hypothetical protein KJ015_01805 [Myxococcales bacterium]|nr:hypothetical protein [Myxococcales bacterium]
MRRALRSLLIALLAAPGCARPAAAPSAARPSACDAPTRADTPTIELPSEPEWGARVSAVELRGTRRVPEALLRAAIEIRAGETLDEERVAADVRRLYALEAFSQVVAETDATPGGVRLRFVVEERRLVGRVDYRGIGALPLGRHVPLREGELFDPARIHRAAQGLEDHLVESGHLDARVRSHQRRDTETVDVCFAVEAGPRYTLAELVPVGNHSVPSSELSALVDDHDGEVNRPGAPFRPDLLGPARLRIQALYFDRGFLDVALGEPRVVRDEGSRTLRVEWPIQEGTVYRLARVTFSGKLRGPEQRYRELLGVAPGQVFSRARIAEGLGRIREHHETLGHSAQAVPEIELDPREGSVGLRVSIEERAP